MIYTDAMRLLFPAEVGYGASNFSTAAGYIASLVNFKATPPSAAQLDAAVQLIKARDIRAERARMIAASDWTQLSDAVVTVAQKTAWAAYRQALRDITLQATFPNSVDYPVSP